MSHATLAQPLSLAQEIRLQSRHAARQQDTRRPYRTDLPAVTLERDVEVAEELLRAALGRMLAARGLPGVKRVIRASLLELADHVRCVANWES